MDAKDRDEEILDLTPLEKAATRLREALEARLAEPENAFIQDSVIQRFEFTYELSHKMLRRYLLMYSASPEMGEELAFPDLIRTGAQRGLLRSSWDQWHRYRKARATSSHAYDQQKALEVLAIVPEFLEEAEYLLAALARRVKS